MTNLYIDPATGDLYTTGGITLVRGIDAARQRIQNALEMWLGEFFLDLREGVPMREAVLVKRPDLGIIEEVFRGVILRDPEISSVDSMSLTLDRETRSLTVDWVAIWEDGTPIGPLTPLVLPLSRLGERKDL